MHSKHRGKAKSRKPVVEIGKAPAGAELTKQQVEELIVKYAKQGMGPALIGEKLKRKHNVPYVRQITGKRLVAILEENKLSGEIPSDLMDLMRTAVGMRNHLGKNKQDVANTVRLRRIESKIWRLTKYYVREGKLPEQWKYDPAQAELLIRGKG